MAIQRDFTSFASSLGLNTDGENIQYSMMTSHNGRSFLRFGVTTPAANSGWTFKNYTNVGTVTDGQTAVARVRLRLRLITAFNVSRPLFTMVGGASLFQNCGVIMTSSRTLQCYVNTVNGGPISTGSASNAVPLGYADDEGWVTADITVTVTANGASDVMDVSCDITFADGSTQTITHTTGAVSLGTPNVSSSGFFTVPSGAGFTTNWSGCIDFAECIFYSASNSDVASLPALPPIATRIRECEITAQGSLNGIAYSSGATFRSMRKRWGFASLGGDSRLTTTTAGQQSDFAHAGVDRFGAAQTYGFKVIQEAQAGGTPTAQFMINGATQAGQGTLGATTHPKYVDTTQRDQATFDAMSFGVQSALSSGNYDCRKIQIEVIHDGGKWDPDEIDFGGGYQQAWITWTGNGSSPRTLSGAPFRPQAAIVFSPNVNVTPKFMAVTHGDTSFNCAGVCENDAFMGFTADGLVVGGTLNTNTQAYRALLIRDDGTAQYDVSGPTPVISGYQFRFHIGSFGNHLGVPYGFGELAVLTPDLMFGIPAHGSTSAYTYYKTRGMPAGTTFGLNTTAQDTGGLRIASYDANGFTLGSQVITQVATANDLCALYFMWADDDSLRDLVLTRVIPAITSMPSNAVTGTPTWKDYTFSFEDDAEAVTPTLLNAAHTRTGSGTAASSITGFTVASGSNRYLMVACVTYGTGGTRTCTLDGNPMTLLYDVNFAFMRLTIHYAVNPTAGSSTIAYSSSTSLSSYQLGAFHVAETDGPRWVGWSSTVSTYQQYYPSRLHDLVVAILSTDPLDAGETLTAPASPWTELWNDANASAAGSAAWRDGLADTEVAAVYSLTGTDVTGGCIVGFMPAGRPPWDPMLMTVKARSSIANLRMDDAAFASTSVATWNNQTINVTNEIPTHNDQGFDIVAFNAAGAYRGAVGYAFAIANDGDIIVTSPPTSNADTYETLFETTLTVPVDGVLANDNTHGGGGMTAVLEDDVALGTLTLNSDGSFVYVPPAGFSGVVSFTYRAWNSQGAGTLATVSITVLEPQTLVNTIRHTARFELGLGGSYRRVINSFVPRGFWFLSDVRTTVAADEAALDSPGTYQGGPETGRGMLPEWGLSTAFDGATQYVELDWSIYGLDVSFPFTIAALVRPAAGGLGAVQCIASSGASGLWLGLNASNQPEFGLNGGAKVTHGAALEAGRAYLLVGNYLSGNAYLYVGDVDAGAEIVAGVVTPIVALVENGPTSVTIGAHGATGMIGRNTGGGEFFEGDIQGVALSNTGFTDDQVQAIYEACLWCRVDEDVSDRAGCTIDRGIHDDSPSSRFAAAGQCTFALDNSSLNIAGVEGFWSPGHENACPNFDRRTPVRVTLIEVLDEEPETVIAFIGVVRDIVVNPKDGEIETQLAAADWLDEAARAPLAELPAEVDITADEAIAIILNNMRNKPHELVLGAGSEVYPFALDNAQEERGKVRDELQRIVSSEFGLAYMTGPGAFVFENRVARAFSSDAAYTFTRAGATEQTVMSTIVPRRNDRQVRNRVMVDVHPRRRDAAATTVLYENDQPIRLDNGVQISMFLGYRDPSQTAQRIGGIDVSTPAPTTDYLINTAEDGSGTNVTTNPNITIEFRVVGNGVYLDALNSYGAQVYITTLQVIGRGLYDFQPITVIDEDEDRQNAEGVQEERIDMPYQALASVGQAVAGLVKESYNATPTSAEKLTFPMRGTDDHENAARLTEISQRVGVVERVSGIDAEFYVNAKRIEWRSGDDIDVILWLAPASSQDYWILDEDALDVGTRLAPG